MRATLLALLALAVVSVAEGGPAWQDKSSDKAKSEKHMKDSENPRVKFETTMGDIVIELNAEKAPISVKNFLEYVDAGFYDGTVFHRCMDNFMVQGGGFTADGEHKKTREPIKNECKNGLKNERGTIAMARTGAPHSATSQFFINLKHNTFLDYKGDKWAYAVFGKVVEGMDVVDKFTKVDRKKNEMQELAVPIEPIVIKKASRL